MSYVSCASLRDHQLPQLFIHSKLTAWPGGINVAPVVSLCVVGEEGGANDLLV
jgi:hypothetical protein